MQLAILLEPCCNENMFAGHIKHAVEPMSDLYVPAAHCAHAPPFAPVCPGLHSQTASETLPAGECELSGQNKHVTAPGIGWYVVVGHIVHGPPIGPVKPALHTQSAMLMLPAGRTEPAGHPTHATAPAPNANVPAEHSEHAAEPVSFLNLPGTHATHCPPSGPEKPALHKQLLIVVLPMGETEFAGQIEHVPEPDTCLYFPASHGQSGTI